MVVNLKSLSLYDYKNIDSLKYVSSNKLNSFYEIDLKMILLKTFL